MTKLTTRRSVSTIQAYAWSGWAEGFPITSPDPFSGSYGPVRRGATKP
nr:hypothetical protein [Acrocarpospora macrocephala]